MKSRSIFTLFIFSAISTANAVESINVQTFNPSTSDHFVLLEDGLRSEWPLSSKYFFGANYNYVNEPLIATNSTGTLHQFTIIDSIQTFDFYFGFKPISRMGIYFGLPIHTIQYSSTPTAPYPTGTASGLGDLKILGKIRVTDDTSSTAISLIPEFHLPTGNTENFVSDASTLIALRAAFEHHFDHFTLVENIGFVYAAQSNYQSSSIREGIDYRKRLLLGIGGFLPVNDTWGFNAEFSSINVIPMSNSLNPNELYGGVRLTANDSWIFTSGASIGKIGSSGQQNFRVIVGLRYTFFETLQDKPYVPEPIQSTTDQTTPPTSSYASQEPTSQTQPSAPPPPLAPFVSFSKYKLEVSPPIEFSGTSTTMTPGDQLALNEIAEVLKTNAGTYKKILIDGHTQNIGTDTENIQISFQRAKAIKAYLIQKRIPAQQLEARGFGARKLSQKNGLMEFLIIR